MIRLGEELIVELSELKICWANHLTFVTGDQQLRGVLRPRLGDLEHGLKLERGQVLHLIDDHLMIDVSGLSDHSPHHLLSGGELREDVRGLLGGELKGLIEGLSVGQFLLDQALLLILLLAVSHSFKRPWRSTKHPRPDEVKISIRSPEDVPL